MTTPNIAAVGASSHPPTCWSPVNDHRWIADVRRGLFYVVDAFGPTYGGYYAPFGIDPGLAALDAAFDDGCGVASQRLLHAVQAAHREMRRLASAHENAFEARLRAGEQDRLRAAMAAADEVRPAQWAHLAGRSFGHFGGSITACCWRDINSVAIAQVGACRAYRCRAGQLELLVPDHMLSTVIATQGKPDTALSHHPGVVTSLLGVSDDLRLDVANVSVEPEDTIILCSHSVWSRSGELVEDLCRHRLDVTDLERLVAACAAREKQDATIVVIPCCRSVAQQERR